MIRRDWPLGAVTPDRWVLVPQVEHARLSAELAHAWGGPNHPPVVCPADEPDHPLAGVRRELLAAIAHHDDGWLGWSKHPSIDPTCDRPYSFNEMPPAEAQTLWTASIEACRELGPLAGWVVASHFHTLQSKRDADYAEWIAWLEQVDRLREAWLLEWLALSPEHSEPLAEACLAWLRTLDWASLWLCCVCPALPGDRPPAEPLTLDGGGAWDKPVTLRWEAGALAVEGWPFTETGLRLTAPGVSLALGRYRPEEVIPAGEAVRLEWELRPPG